MRVERVRRTKCRVDGGAAKHSGNVSGDGMRQRHDWMRVLFGGMRELFQSSKCSLCSQIQHARVCRNHLEIEGCDLVEEIFRRSKPSGMSMVIAKRLSKCFCRLRHCACFLLMCHSSHKTSFLKYSRMIVLCQQREQGLKPTRNLPIC